MKYSSILITGASSGLGAEFARQLAPHCEQMILVARRKKRLQELADELTKEFSSLDIQLESVDLSDKNESLAFVQKIKEGQYTPEFLINNAGLGDLGSFALSDWDKLEKMLRVNMLALTQLTHAVVPSMRAKKRGFILNVSSMASIMPIPDFSAYAASKAYVTSFSEALRLELREDGIFVTALCPGPVKTEFGEIATRDDRKEMPMKAWTFVAKELVVNEAIKAIEINKPLHFPGWFIRFGSFFLSHLPLCLLRMILATRPRRTD